MPRITEIKVIQVCHDTPCNPFYVAWLSPVGWEHWMFGTAQEFKSKVSVQGKHGIYVEDVSTATSSSRVIKKEQQTQVKLFAEQLTLNQVQGLETMLGSTSIYWLADVTNEMWQEIEVVPGTFDLYDSDHNTHEVELSVLLPKKYLQSN